MSEQDKSETVPVTATPEWLAELLAAAKTAGASYASAMDKAIKSGVVHRNAASRAKAHVAKYVLAKQA